MKFCVLALLFLSLNAFAQYDGPAVEACRAYARKEAARDGGRPEDIVIVRDGALLMERYERKLGDQTLSSILTGNGAVVFDNAPSAELAFICLLAGEKRPVFFNWLPRRDVSALAQCTRSEALRDKPRACLEVLLRVAEVDLTQAYALRFQEARAADFAASNEKLLGAYRKSNDEWRQYRDAECARQRDFPPKGVSPEHTELACMVELTRRRGLDMR